MTPGIEEYLEAIYNLQEESKAVTTKELANYLEIAPPSVTDMIKKLAKKNLVDYMPYKGVKLTRAGRKKATEMIRKHRLSEVFLSEIIGLPWHEVHDEACRFEHVISDKVEKKLFEVLDNPETCPHGNPIPGVRLSSKKNPSSKKELNLKELPIGKEAIISKIEGEDKEFLKYLSNVGIRPGRKITITKSAPFDGPYIIRIKNEVHPISRSTASKIFIKM